MQLAPRSLIVAEVCEPTGLLFEAIRPVRIGAAGLQGDELGTCARAAGVAEAALVADRKQSTERVITSVSGVTALVVRVNDEVCGRQLREWEIDPRHRSEVTRGGTQIGNRHT